MSSQTSPDPPSVVVVVEAEVVVGADVVVVVGADVVVVVGGLIQYRVIMISKESQRA